MFKRTKTQAGMPADLADQFAREVAAYEAQPKRVVGQPTYATVETHEVPMDKLHEALGIIRNEGGFILQSVQVGTSYRITVAL